MEKQSDKIKAQVKEQLEMAYKLLNMAANDYDLIDGVEAAKIIKVRRDILNLLTIDLDL